MIIAMTVNEDRDTVEIVADGKVIATVRTGVVDGEVQIEIPGAPRATMWAEIDIGGRCSSPRATVPG